MNKTKKGNTYLRECGRCRRLYHTTAQSSEFCIGCYKRPHARWNTGFIGYKEGVKNGAKKDTQD